MVTSVTSVKKIATKTPISGNNSNPAIKSNKTVTMCHSLP